jgi:D-amino peptidase
MMTGMHAASGTNGFLPHTLTSRLSSLTVNGRPLAEVELFAASLAPYGIPAIFFSGCPAACAQARDRIAGIHTLPIDKTVAPDQLDATAWRGQLADAAVRALANDTARPYTPKGPFEAVVTIRDGAGAAAKMADRWGFRRTGDTVTITAPDIHTLYMRLIRLCYLSPLAERTLPVSLGLFNGIGWLGRLWVRRRLKT